MRADHEKAQTTLCCHEFTLQRYFCNARNLKCQKESFLLFLQKCTQEKLISPLPFVHPADDASGFLGWTGFRILPGCGDKFRAGVDGLFPETPKLNTLYHLFRRAGLVPEDWRRAWEGEVKCHKMLAAWLHFCHSIAPILSERLINNYFFRCCLRGTPIVCRRMLEVWGCKKQSCQQSEGADGIRIGVVGT